MSDHREFGNGPQGASGDPQDTGELLAAYLADELDEVRARGLERRLEADADLRADLDRIHEVVVRLRRVDAVAPPEGLDARIRKRLAAQEGSAPTSVPAFGASPKSRRTTAHAAHERRHSPAGTPGERSTDGNRPAASEDAIPWWRRPVAAVAALALLGVVGLSSLGIVAVGGSGEDSAGQRDTAIMAQGAEEAAGGGDAAVEAAPDSDEQADAETGELEAFGSDGSGDAAAGASESALAGPVVMDVPDLASTPDRLAYLEDVRSRPETRDLAATSADDVTRGEHQRAALQDLGLDTSCAEELVPPGSAAVELITTEVEGNPAVGAVLADDAGGLTLLLIDPGACQTLAEEELPG